MKEIIVIPVYKPTSDLIEFVEKLIQHFDIIVIVNDGSIGKEYEWIFERLSEIEYCTVLEHYTNMGKGRALKTAFNYCIMLAKKQDISGIITVDADGQHSIRSILNVREKMRQYPLSLVLGCRDFSSDIPLRSQLGNKITKWVFKWLCEMKISDTQTGLRGIPAQYMEMCCHIDGEKYEYETNMLLKAKEEEISIVETKIDTIYENNNQSSHFNPLLDSIKIYKSIFMYSLSSLCAILIDFVTFTVMVNSGVNLFICTYCGRLLSSLANFAMNRKLVFKVKEHLLLQFVEYMCLVVVSGTISAFIVSLLSRNISLHPLWIKIPVESLLFFMNYFIQNNVIFRKGN